MKEEKHEVFIKDNEVVGAATSSTVTEENIISTVEVGGVDSTTTQQVDKKELKEIEQALRDDKKKVMIENGKPRIRLLDDRGKIK